MLLIPIQVIGIPPQRPVIALDRHIAVIAVQERVEQQVDRPPLRSSGEDSVADTKYLLRGFIRRGRNDSYFIACSQFLVVTESMMRYILGK